MKSQVLHTVDVIFLMRLQEKFEIDHVKFSRRSVILITSS